MAQQMATFSLQAIMTSSRSNLRHFFKKEVGIHHVMSHVNSTQARREVETGVGAGTGSIFLSFFPTPPSSRTSCVDEVCLAVFEEG
ncbi:hypothetical protein HMI55_005749 [Coelomomyces lativittatus]|nr:hypothetical protein HMI55_005749 [Coelomomyces lativittatus]